VGGLVLAVALLARIERIAGRAGTRLVAAVGAAMAATSIAFLLLSENTVIFGFRETGYRAVIVLVLVVEAIAVLALMAFLAASSGGDNRRRAN
jgi:Kef-type K+ transport system membrane component KefB